MPTQMVMKGIPTSIVPAGTAVGSPVNGSAYALSSFRQNRPVTWRTAFGTAPGAVSVALQGIIDPSGSAWFDIDTSTAVGGETRTVSAAAFPNVTQIRGRMNSVTGGSTFAVEVIV